MTYQLGIDTGGTYTDAVLVDIGAGGRRKILAKNKSLTTRYDLSVGIHNALSNLPPKLLPSVNLVALSTTLSTNSVVEGRGAPVAVLLPGYSEAQVQKSGLARILPAESILLLDGGHSAVGAELAPLDSARAARWIQQQEAQVSAFAVSALFATRNPSHEIALSKLIADLTGKPVACGHELATSLGAPRRALTAVLNARMILYIQTLIKDVRLILRRHKIRAQLMVVKGDGSLINAQTALRQPVATVLSGPAASVIGACALSGQRDAIVVDMGGTTTDIAVVTDGKPQLCEHGATIGDWQPMVEALRVFSIGLGGDSEVRFKGKLELSQRRVVPMSLLVHQYPALLEKLELQWRAPPSARDNRFALPLQPNAALLARLNANEERAWQRVQEGAVELQPLADSDRALLRALASLERMGLVIYSGFTPSDATHVLGMSKHWSADGARLAAKIWARQMRHLYGCGNWHADDAETPCRQVFELVTQAINQALLQAGLHQLEKLRDIQARNLSQLFAEFVLGGDGELGTDGARQSPNENGGAGSPRPAPKLFQIEFAKNYPIVAVGGAAADYFPQVAKTLAVELHRPRDAEIANAIGAVLGAVVQTAHITITQPQFGVFYLFHKEQPMVFEKLEAAKQRAVEIAKREAAALAKKAGATAIETRIQEQDNHVRHDIDGELFVSTTITAVATGRPNLAAR